MPLIKFIDGWETVAEMEAALGIPAGNLAATLDRYNENAADGHDPDFHKQPDYVAAQDKGPWAAFDLSLGRAMYSGFTMGGLTVSIDGEVLRDDGSPVAGLYAAGRVRVQHRPGRQGLRQRHPARRGLVLRAAGGRARRAAGPGYRGAEQLDPRGLSGDHSRPSLARCARDLSNNLCETCGAVAVEFGAHVSDPRGLPADDPELPLALAEQLELVGVMLLDGAAVADADQDGVRAARCGPGRTA